MLKPTIFYINTLTDITFTRFITSNFINISHNLIIILQHLNQHIFFQEQYVNIFLFFLQQLFHHKLNRNLQK